MLGSLAILAGAPFFIAKVSWNNKRRPNGNLCANALFALTGLDGELIFVWVADLLRRAVTIGYEDHVYFSDIPARVAEALPEEHLFVTYNTWTVVWQRANVLAPNAVNLLRNVKIGPKERPYTEPFTSRVHRREAVALHVPSIHVCQGRARENGALAYCLREFGSRKCLTGELTGGGRA